MRIYRPPLLLRSLYPGAFFRIPAVDNKLYLTFDDGPTSGVTDIILDILASKGVHSTFFMTGSRISANGDLYSRIADSGFGIGNHGMEHISGLRTGNSVYIRNIESGEKTSGSLLFRPPYGAIKISQFRNLKQRYRIVFWDVMPYDFDRKLSPDRVLQVLKSNIRSGSIIVLHDNIKSVSPLILSEFLDYCLDKGYKFGNLTEELS